MFNTLLLKVLLNIVKSKGKIIEKLPAITKTGYTITYKCKFGREYIYSTGRLTVYLSTLTLYNVRLVTSKYSLGEFTFHFLEVLVSNMPHLQHKCSWFIFTKLKDLLYHMTLLYDVISCSIMRLCLYVSLE